MKILVTGGLGFVGSNLITRLKELGYQINVLDNEAAGAPVYISTKNINIIKGDLLNIEDINLALKDVDLVVHLAAAGSVLDSVQNPEINFNNNVVGTFNLLNQCRLSGIKKIIFSSTGGALIGNTTPPVDENSLPRPISPYGSSKLCCESYCSSFASSYEIDIIALRFANIIGPYSWHKKGAVTKLIKSLLNEEPFTIYGNGESTRDYLDVRDLIEGIVSAIDTEIKGFTPIHLSSGEETSIERLVRTTLDIAEKVNHPIYYSDTNIGEVERNFADHSLASSLLKFKPSRTLEESLIDIWKWSLSYSQIKP